MKVKTIHENSDILIEDDYLDRIKAIIDQNPHLPMQMRGNTLSFKSYTIGEFRVDDLAINIIPRNKAFSLESFFQILQFIDRPLIKEIDGYGFENASSLFTFSALSKEFCQVCSMLLQFGLTGSYTSDLQFETTLGGDVYFDEYRSQLIPYHGLPSIVSEYELNTPANQIIKSALCKLIAVEENWENLEKFQIARDLDRIEVVSFSQEEVINTKKIFYSTNPYYLPCLELAERILFGLELQYCNGDIQWLAFLENSNSIFERYVLEVLNLYLSETVIKWTEPRSFAQLRSSFAQGEKSYAPDILINYNRHENSSSVVLDVKNKTFEPADKKGISDVVMTSDIYQIMFYCKQLHTNLGGIVYPSTTDNEPIKVTFDIDSDLEIYLFSINMLEFMELRHAKLIADVGKCLLSKT